MGNPNADPARTDSETVLTAKMIAACRFDFVSPDIAKITTPHAGPPADPTQMRVVMQSDLNGKTLVFMSTSQVLAAIARLGCRPATAAELLIWARSRRRWNRENWVYGLGSSWTDAKRMRKFPCVCDPDDEGMSTPSTAFCLVEDPRGGAWYVSDGFLIVPVEPSRFVAPTRRKVGASRAGD